MVNDGNNNAQHDANKRQRLDDTSEQRTAFSEDMARIRSAMGSGGGRVGGSETAAAADGSGGGAESMGDNTGGNERSVADNSGASDLPQQQGGESTVQQQQQQPSGESTLQQQHQQAHQTHASNRESRALDSEDEEDGNKWLQHYTQHHTRVGSNYQVADLPSSVHAAAAAAPAASSSSCVSPGGNSGE